MSGSNSGLFNWKHLVDKKLYQDNDYAIECLKNGISICETDFANEGQNSAMINYHCYWYGKIGNKQSFSIKSFLCTQDLKACKLILWLDITNGYLDYDTNPYLVPLLPYIEVKPYNPFNEALGTPWESHTDIPAQRYDLVKRSDAFRFLILYKYGGVYFDLDVMFLRNLGELVNAEFCYAWETQPYANSAVLNLKHGSQICEYLLQKTIKTRDSSPWKIFLYSDLFLKDLYVLPCAFFDPIWQGVSIESSPLVDFSGFFRKFDFQHQNKLEIESFKNFFPGCFAYHWHNQWNAIEYEESFFGMFNAQFNSALNINQSGA